MKNSSDSLKSNYLFNLFANFIYVTTNVNYTAQLLFFNDQRIVNLIEKNDNKFHTSELEYSIDSTFIENKKLRFYTRKRIELSGERKLCGRASNYYIKNQNNSTDNSSAELNTTNKSPEGKLHNYNDIGSSKWPVRLLIKLFLSFCFIIKFIVYFFSYEKNKSSGKFHNLIFCDIFTSYKCRKMLNIVGAAMLLSSTICMTIELIRSLMVKCGLLTGVCSIRKQKINIVQVNLTYIKSLKTTAKYWYRLVYRSWFHKHRDDGHIGREHRLVNNSLLFKHGRSSLKSVNISTKMYAINMISFNKCFKEYFREDKILLAEDEQCDDLNCEKNVVTSMKLNSHLVKGKQFVAKPLHRCDLNEMAWLLFFLFVMHGADFVTYIFEVYSSVMIELNYVKTLDRFDSHWPMSLSMIRLFQINLWYLIVLLDLYDLYLFFACSLICSSRARYIYLKLKTISEECSILGEINNDLQQNSDNKFLKLAKSQYSNVNVSESKLMNSYIGKRSAASQINHHHSNQYKTLNDNISFLVDIILVLQRELEDIKNFFGLHLNIELFIKPPCIAYCIVSFIESEINLEFLFICLVTNLCLNPILVSTATAAWVEVEFKSISKELDKIISNGKSYTSASNLRRIMAVSIFLNEKANRSFIIFGNFSLTLGSLVPLLAWVATGVVVISRV